MFPRMGGGSCPPCPQWDFRLWFNPSVLLPPSLCLWKQEIAEPLFDLKLGMEQLAKNKTFKRILATLLAIGNFLNSTSVRETRVCLYRNVRLVVYLLEIKESEQVLDVSSAFCLF